jgi:hypothetical protein
MEQKYGTDCAWDENDDPVSEEAERLGEELHFEVMERSRALWEAHLKAANPEYLSRWQAWRNKQKSAES